jgi:hypothetical protein
MSIEKIAAIEPKGSFESTFGTMFAFAYSFESGMEGDASHKTQQPPFRPGQQVEVTITGDFKGRSKIKVARPEGARGSPSFQQPVAATISGNVPVTLVPGVSTTIHGATVGCCLKMANDDLREAHTDKLDDHDFCAKWMWKRGSAYLRAYQALEGGKLWEDPAKAAKPAPVAPTPPQRVPQPAHDSTAAFSNTGGADASLPF